MMKKSVEICKKEAQMAAHIYLREIICMKKETEKECAKGYRK